MTRRVGRQIFTFFLWRRGLDGGHDVLAGITDNGWWKFSRFGELRGTFDHMT